MIYATANGAKLVVRVNYRLKKTGLMNIVQTGHTVYADALNTLRAEIGGMYQLIEGGL
ncbi:MAG: hypothetical protein AB1810_09695 [Pseudomonadota bacterium]